jgi:heptosyltransferase-1
MPNSVDNGSLDNGSLDNGSVNKDSASRRLLSNGPGSTNRVLIVKTSSLGDVIHTLPALCDARKHRPELIFDWLVEEEFKDIPDAHPLVDKTITVALRRWRKAPVSALTGGELRTFKQSLRDNTYDLVIDAQGLLKSALLTRWVPADVVGFDRLSLREPLARFFYSKTVPVHRNMHAVERVRNLFAKALGYDIPREQLDYGFTKGFKEDFTKSLKKGLEIELKNDIDRANRSSSGGGLSSKTAGRLIFLHGTTWQSKHWPEQHWRELAVKVEASEYEAVIPWGNITERQRALRIADQLDSVTVLPRLSLADLLKLMQEIQGAFCVDTGLGHLAAAMDVPVTSFYGPTDPTLTGIHATRQISYNFEQPVCTPCLKRECPLINTETPLQPCFAIEGIDAIWDKMMVLMENSRTDPVFDK